MGRRGLHVVGAVRCHLVHADVVDQQYEDVSGILIDTWIGVAVGVGLDVRAALVVTGGVLVGATAGHQQDTDGERSAHSPQRVASAGSVLRMNVVLPDPLSPVTTSVTVKVSSTSLPSREQMKSE